MSPISHVLRAWALCRTAGMGYGWLSPDGEFYPLTGRDDHETSAPRLIKEVYGEAEDPGRDGMEILFKRMWTRVGYIGRQHLFTTIGFGPTQKSAIDTYLASNASPGDEVALEDWADYGDFSSDAMNDFEGTVEEFMEGPQVR